MTDSRHLVASHPGNTHAERSGAFARRSLAADVEVQELAAAILAEPHVSGMDELGAVEIAKLLVLIDRIDADIAKRGVVRGKAGDPRAVLHHRRMFSAQLERWLAAYGLTPSSRADLLRAVATGGLAADIAQRRQAARKDTQ